MPYDISVTGDMARLEWRRHQLALMTMKCSLAAENAVANGGTKGIVNGIALVKVVGMLNQNVLNVLGPVEENAREWPKIQTGDIADARHSLEEAQTIVVIFG